MSTDGTHEPGTVASTAGPQSPEDTVTVIQKTPGAIPSRFGRYQIERLLGSGGMGAVYLALDTQLDRRVALKIPRFELEDREGVERFYREARLAARLQRHNQLCPIYDVGEFERVPFLTMSFIDGQPLSKLVSPACPMPETQAAEIVLKVAVGMDEAHRQGVLHRDLKPSNIMLDAKGEPVIMDFGLARDINLDTTLTQPGNLLGTLPYMSPEQIHGEMTSLTPAADVYSLGIILYELLTGNRPFRGAVPELIAKVLLSPAEPPSSCVSQISAEADRICLKAIARSTSERYPQMRDLADDLRRLLNTSSNLAVISQAGHALADHPEDKNPILPGTGSKPVLRLRATLEGHADRIGNLAWSFNGRKLATPSDDGTVRIWDPETGRCEQVLGPFPGEVGSVAWTRNGRKLAIGCADHNAYVVRTGEERPSLTVSGHTALIRSVSWSPGGEFLATASDDESACLWNEEGTRCSEFRLGSRVTTVSFSQVALLAATDEGVLHFLLTSPRYSGTRQIGFGSHLHAAWSADNRLVAVGSADTSVYVWDVRRREVTQTLVGHRDNVGGVSFSPDGRYLATKSSRDRVVKLWELGTGKVVAEIEEVGDPRVYLWHSSLAFHPSLPLLATLGIGDRVVRIWEVGS